MTLMPHTSLLRALGGSLRLPSFRLSVLAVLVVVADGAGANAERASYRAAFDDRVLTDVDRSRTVPIALWYPTTITEEPLAYSPAQAGHAARGAPIARGRWPLVILSHGSGGNRFNQSALAETMARSGFIVVALEHPGDRTFDHGDSRTVRNLVNRPQDVRFALDEILRGENALAAAIDGRRIAMIGHSAGGFTAVVAAGGRPDLANLEAYCRQNPTADPDTCPGDRQGLAEDRIERVSLEGGLSLTDSRVRAVVLMAPAIGALFDAQALADVSVPVLLFWAGRDEILNEPHNSRYYANGPARVHERALPDIGHFTFLNECSVFLATAAPEICRDPPGIDRADVLETIAAETITFLRRALQR